MFELSTIKTKKYSVQDVYKLVTNIAPRSGNDNTLGHISRKERAKIGLKLISQYVQANRSKLFGTSAGFKIVTNGWGEFKSIRITHTDEEFNADYIFKAMRESEKNGCIMPSTMA